MQKQDFLKFIFFILVVLAVNSYFLGKRTEQPTEQRHAETISRETPELASARVEDASPETPQTEQPTLEPEAEPRVESVTGEPTFLVTGPETAVRVRSDLYDVTFNTRGARATSWKLIQWAEMSTADSRLLALQIKQYTKHFSEDMTLEQAEATLTAAMLPYFRAYLDLREKLEQARRFEQAQRDLKAPFPGDLAVELIPQEGPELLGTFLLERNGAPLDSGMLYACEESEIVVDTTKTVTFSVRTNEMDIQKVYTFYPDRYECALEIQVTYLTGEETADRGTVELVAARALGRYLEGASGGRKGASGQAAIVQMNGKMKKILLQGQKLGAVRDYAGVLNWFGMENRYFIGALVPQQELELAKTRTREVQGTADVVVALPIGRLAPGSPKRFGFNVFMGPKDTELLVPLGAGVHNAVFSTGFLRALRLSWICPLILWLLKALYRVIPNYGVGILILSVLAKWVTYPLTIKQLRAMKKMQELSPQIQELREKFKDNPRELQKKTMELYSQNGANPMGSCLPMLLQMPVFIGLFMTLNYAIQLRGAPFVLWIDDLSKPDALFYIPFSLPMFGFVSLNVIPLLMGAITYLQQSKQVVDPQQAFMAKFMPIFFTVLLWNFPSGVILYWTVSSLLQGVQQRVMDQPKHGG